MSEVFGPKGRLDQRLTRPPVKKSPTTAGNPIHFETVPLDSNRINDNAPTAASYLLRVSTP